MATPIERLAEAEAARHALLTGSKVAKVSTADGESVDYAAVDVEKLDAYIGELRRAAASSVKPRSRSVKVFYG